MGKATEYHFTPSLKWSVMFSGMGLDSEQYKTDGFIDLHFYQKNIVNYIDTDGSIIFKERDIQFLTETTNNAQFSQYDRICFAPNNYDKQKDSKVFDVDGNYWKFEMDPDYTFNMALYGYNSHYPANPISQLTSIIRARVTQYTVLQDGTKTIYSDGSGNAGGHSFAFTGVGGWYDASRGAPEGQIEIYSNIPVYGNMNDAMAYLTTGKLKPTVDTFEYRMHTKTFNSNVSGEYLAEKAKTLTTFTIEKESGADIGKVAGYVVESETQYNIALKYDEVFASQLKTRAQYINGVDRTDYTNPFHTYTTLHYTDAYYIGQILADTNIPIYRSEGDADAYINDTGNPDPIYDNGGSGSGENTTGDADAETSMNDMVENGTILSSVYVMTKEQLEAFGGVIYSDNTEVITAIKEGLALYGENPITFVVDCFYLPFDVSTFISTLPVSSIKFGSYVAQLSALKVTKNNTLTTLATVDIVGAYNDYRDYDFNYYLYLPYVGFTLLDIEMIIYKTLTIKAFFDVRTGNIKYYLFAGLNLIKTFEGNIRVSMPLASSDKVAQAGQYIKGIDSIVSGSMSTGMEIGSAIATKGASLAGGIGGGIPSIINGAMELQKGAPKSVSGNSSPSTAILDALYPYLIIEKPIYKNASNVRAEYNKPDMSVRKIGDTNGYGIFTDVMLETDADEEERSEILSLLSAGVIV